MGDRVHLVRYGAGVPLYAHGQGHPMRPERFLLTERLIDAYGMLGGDRVVAVPAREATDEELLLVHAPHYVAAGRGAGAGGAGGGRRGPPPPPPPGGGGRGGGGGGRWLVDCGSWASAPPTTRSSHAC